MNTRKKHEARYYGTLSLIKLLTTTNKIPSQLLLMHNKIDTSKNKYPSFSEDIEGEKNR